MRFADLPRVLDLERRCFGDPWSMPVLAAELSRTRGLALTLVDDGQVLGYLVCSPRDDGWHLMKLGVDPSHRRMGHGHALVRALLGQLPASADVRLEVRRSNVPAMRLYASLGFVNAGILSRYYRDNLESAVVMRRATDS